MQFIKSLIFYLLFYFVVITVLIIAIPTLIMQNFALICKFLANLIILVLKVSLNVKVFFHGLDNLKKLEKFLLHLLINPY